jgi:hypothetical protein
MMRRIVTPLLPVNTLSPRVAQKQTDLRSAPQSDSALLPTPIQVHFVDTYPSNLQLRVKTNHDSGWCDAAVAGNLSAHKDPNARLRTRTAAHDYLSANTCCDPPTLSVSVGRFVYSGAVYYRLVKNATGMMKKRPNFFAICNLVNCENYARPPVQYV